MKVNKTWILYTFFVAFAAYWLASLLLWYPWSYSATLGMVIMFVAITPIWIYAVFLCLQRYPSESMIQGALYTSIIFMIIAVVLDYFFYGIIRDAMMELYHPTTLYGYAFLAALPFAEVFLFRKRLQSKSEIRRIELVRFGMLGVICLLAIVVIIVFDLNIS